MKALKVALALGIGATAIAAEVVHCYLDLMYKETIPQTLLKKYAFGKGTTGMKEFDTFTRSKYPWIEAQNIEVIDRRSPRGYNLKGYLLEAEEKSDVFVLFAHGYRANHLGDPANHVRYYHEMGYNYMSVDHVAAGDSGGDFIGFDYFESDDMLGWVDYLIERFGKDIKIILQGASMGGATVCQMASRVPSQVKCIISDCAYTSAKDEFYSLAKNVGVSKLAPSLYAIINGLNKKLAKFDLAQTDVRDSVRNSKVPMLFVHGKADDFVPVEMGMELYDICRAEKDLLLIDNAYHAQSIMVGEKKYKKKIVEFTSKYI